MMSWYDITLIISSVLLIILSLLHEFAGVNAYIRGDSIGVFRSRADWIPTSGKERTLLGVFFMISFSWWQNQVVLILLLILGNPLSYWLGIISLLFTIPQMILLWIYIRWNMAALSVFLFHIIAIVIWLTQYV